MCGPVLSSVIWTSTFEILIHVYFSVYILTSFLDYFTSFGWYTRKSYKTIKKKPILILLHPKRLLELLHNKTNGMACVPSEDSDQPGHPPSLIRVFAVRMKKPWVLIYPLNAQQRLWSDWTHRSFCWFCHEVAHICWLLSVCKEQVLAYDSLMVQMEWRMPDSGNIFALNFAVCSWSCGLEYRGSTYYKNLKKFGHPKITVIILKFEQCGQCGYYHDGVINFYLSSCIFLASRRLIRFNFEPVLGSATAGSKSGIITRFTGMVKTVR